jgi:hypothetical protein
MVEAAQAEAENGRCAVVSPPVLPGSKRQRCGSSVGATFARTTQDVLGAAKAGGGLGWRAKRSGGSAARDFASDMLRIRRARSAFLAWRAPRAGNPLFGPVG